MIKSLKQKLSQFRSEATRFNDNIYRDTVEHCEKNNLVISKVKKRKISTRINQFENN